MYSITDEFFGHFFLLSPGREGKGRGFLSPTKIAGVCHHFGNEKAKSFAYLPAVQI